MYVGSLLCHCKSQWGILRYLFLFTQLFLTQASEDWPEKTRGVDFPRTCARKISPVGLDWIFPHRGTPPEVISTTVALIVMRSATIVGDHCVIRSMIVIVFTRSTTEMDDGLRQGEKLRPAGSRSHASPSSRDDHRDYPHCYNDDHWSRLPWTTLDLKMIRAIFTAIMMTEHREKKTSRGKRILR